MFDGHVLTSNDSVLVIDGVVVKVGKRGDFKGKTVNTRFLLPGLIDMHVHLGTYTDSLYFNDVKLFDYLNKMLLYNGVTTVRDIGNHTNTVYNFKCTENPGPRIFSSIFLDGDNPKWSMSFIVKNEKQVKEIINGYKATGIGWIKAYESIKPRILKSIITEAHSNGLKVAGHLLKTSQKEAILMGIDTLEHIALLINGVDGKVSTSWKDIYENWAKIDADSTDMADLIDCLARSKTAVCPTLILIKMNLFPSSEYSEYLKVLFPASKMYKNKKPKTCFTKIDAAIRKKAFENILKVTKRLNEKGVLLIAGSDATNPFVAPGFSLHQELGLLVDSGLTPIEALRTATSEAAKVLGANGIGQIKPGCKADMILLSEYVDSDINNINKITHVVLNGNIIKVNLKYLSSKSTLRRFLPKKMKKI